MWIIRLWTKPFSLLLHEQRYPTSSLSGLTNACADENWKKIKTLVSYMNEIKNFFWEPNLLSLMLNYGNNTTS